MSRVLSFRPLTGNIKILLRDFMFNLGLAWFPSPYGEYKDFIPLQINFRRKIQ